MKLKALLLISIIITLSSYSFALSIGASPGKLDLGNVEKGEEKLVELTIFSDATSEVAVNIKSLSFVEDYYNPNFKSSEINFDPYEASQESIGSWIYFIENPVVLKPGELDTKTKYPSYITSVKKVSLIVKIPQSADPGYHSTRLSFDAVINNEGTGAKALAITSVDIPIVFRVSGDAVRSGYISGFEVAGNRLNINFYNNGTTTFIARTSTINILKDGKLVKSLSGSSTVSEPKTTKKMSTNIDGIEPGKYEVYSNVVWTTGSSEKSANIFIEAAGQDTTAAGKPIPLNINITTIIIAIAIIIAAIGAVIFIRR